jgi:hypothetical protein
MLKQKVRLDEEVVSRTAARLLAQAAQAGIRMDEGESVFFARQLEHIIAQEFDIEYAELRARAVIPITQEADPADQTVTYREYDRSGLAKLITDYSQDLPRVDITGKEVTAKVRTLGASYGYNIDEVNASNKTGRDLEGRRAETAREAILRQENYILLYGDAAHGLAGFLNFTNVPTYSIPAVGTGASRAWTAKTPDMIIADLSGATNSIPELTYGIEQGDTMLLPRAAYHRAMTARIGRDSTQTAMKFFVGTNSYITSVEDVEILNELNTAGQIAGGSGNTQTRGMVYRRDPLKVRAEIPQDFESLPAQARGFEWVIPCRSRLAGCIWHKPLSAVYFDGI